MCVCAFVQGKYVALKDSPQSESCLYTYSASQASLMSGTQSKLDVSSTVEVFCESVGHDGEMEAKKYCFRLKETSFTTNDNAKILSQVSGDVEKLLNGPFCFVQTEDGRIVSVHHNPEERAQVVNFKKGIAAAFQANFKYTRVEVEEDTQSKHYSQYSYERIAPDHVIMHRVVDSESVIQFVASAVKGKPLKVEREEDVEYKKGKLLSSQGRTLINWNGPADSYDQSRFESTDGASVEWNHNSFDSNFGTGGLAGSGQYSLRLTSCSAKPRLFNRRSAGHQSLITSSTLHAIVQRDTKEMDHEEMSKLRQSMPSIRKVLDYLKTNISDATTSSMVRKLLILESERGALSGFQPAVSEVVDYLNSERDVEMRSFLYSLLAAEGSAKSQEILLNAVRKTSDTKERNSVTVQLAFVRKVRPEIVAEIEKLIRSSNDTTDPLILTYGALAASSPQLRERIVQFLQERVHDAKDNTIVLIHLVHALGNTESSLVDTTLLPLVAHSNPEVRLAAVYSLRYSVESKEVQDALLDGIHNHQDTDFAVAVTRALAAGAEWKQQTGALPVGKNLFEAITQHARNNTELRAMVYYYVILLGPNAPKEWMSVMRTMLHKRDTSTTTWNDKGDSLYDLVEDTATRSSDLTNYPSNKAYMWVKSFGVPDVKLDVAFGAFAGYGGSANPSSFKLYAKGIARVYIYGKTATVFEALIYSENKPGGSSISNRVYISIVGKVLQDISKEIPTCKSWTFPLLNSGDYPLLDLRFSIFVYAGTLDFSITLTTKLQVDALLDACIGKKCVTANAALTPTVTVTATAGASVTLIEIARGGIDLSGSFQYQIVPKISGSYLLLKGPFEICLSLSNAWPDNSISIYVYYQLRKVEWCNGWLGISYPCGFSWGDKNKWDKLSYEWKLQSSPLKSLWSSCDPSKQLQCS
ncbi:hypothetical protein EMCRGX_G018221 [Ephydatia muelleri]